MSLATLWRRWLAAIAWTCLLAFLPWWTGLPLLLGLAVAQLARVPRLLRHGAILRRALRWGLAGVLVAGYRAFDGHPSGVTLTLLAALAGFSLLVLLESWQDHKPLRSASLAAASPAWNEIALAPIGPSATLIELQSPVWMALDDPANGAANNIAMVGRRRCRIGANTLIDHIEPQASVAPGQRWIALPIAAGRGVLLYDRVRDRQYRLRGWRLYGWHAGEAWLSRGEDKPPLALSHVLGQDQWEE
ncbi:hypothetical protein ISP15_13895 [Dyella jejuensis]|uniref:Competence protein ComEC n=1 Tax=Dyella jejuensis TaxID=1432009 RepID=A0ABW8JMJ4_9GAMM